MSSRQDDDDGIPRDAFLKVDADWPAWYIRLKMHSKVHGNDPTRSPEAPVLSWPTNQEIDEEFGRKIKEIPCRITVWSTTQIKYNAILKWVNATVNKRQMGIASTVVPGWKKFHLKDLIKQLQIQMSPTNQAPLLGFKRNIDAPTWANTQLANIIKNELPGKPVTPLNDLGRILRGMIRDNNLRGRKGAGVFATLGGRPPNQCQGAREGSRATTGSTQKRYKCPCRTSVDETHAWTPHSCAILQYAIKGSTQFRIKTPDPNEVEGIKKRWSYTRWNDLRKEIAKSGWKVPRAKTRNQQDDNSLDDNVVCAVIDPTMLSLLTENPGAYSTLKWSPHALSESTLIDNCGALHFVNSKELLDYGSFVEAVDGEAVDARTTQFPIMGTGTRALKGVLVGENGKRRDLTLTKVAVVEGFHVNIVSKARLRDTHDFLKEIPVSAASLVAYNGNTRLKRPWRPSKDPLKPKEDKETLWHLRAGHLRPRALRALVHRARNVRIKGIPRLKLEKTLVDVLGKIRQFERWVIRQFRLLICKIRSDNDKATTATKGKTRYELWTKDEGVNLETPPAAPHTVKVILD
ncbi:hypothetical protein CHU98_g7038 [Xylaria longipes]|nr:hypothetical protein CHU98_g7038 [Xylaria longipes]